MTDHALACLSLRLSDARSAAVREALDHFGDAAEAWRALRQRDRTLERGLRAKHALLDRGLAWLQEPGSHLLAWHEADYPPALRHVASPPPFLFVRGRRELLWHPQVALVGTRKPSAAGLECAHQFARHLAGIGFTVTSGLASGIDAAAHEGALTAGSTLAALATGPDLAFPQSNEDLFEAICRQGAAITEHPPGVPALRSHFPARNRLIAGLSAGTVVIEAAIRSGALITARLAAELGKEVMAVPGSIHNPVAYGCHQLIREGAFLVEQPEEVAHILAAAGGHTAPQAAQSRARTPPAAMAEPALNGAQRQLWQALGHDGVTVDTLCLRTGLTAADISSILVDMEISGWVENQCGRYHRTIRNAPPARG